MLKFTERQEVARQLLAGPQQHTALIGGSRSGKTTLLVDRVLLRAVKAPGSRHGIFRLRGNAARASIALDTLPKVSRIRRAQWGAATALTPHKQEGYFSLPNGSEIWVSGLDDAERVEKILGMEFSTLYFNECSQIPYGSVVMALTRLAQAVNCEDGVPLKPRAYYDLNPGGKGHWSYRAFIEKRDPDTRVPMNAERSADYAHAYLNPADNAKNLAAGYLGQLANLPERARRRFLDGVYQDEIDGALWSLESLDACRVQEDEVPDLQRVVIAVDPSGHNGSNMSRSDMIGMCAAGRGVDGHAYALEDLSCALSPEGWGRRAVEAYHRHKADAVVAEGNFGGDMVRAVIHAQDPKVPVKMVTASRGKVVRAEPVSAFYEERLRQAHHVGDQAKFRELEDELLLFSSSGYQGDRSPNRADALVWALTELMFGAQPAAIVPVVGVGQSSYYRV